MFGADPTLDLVRSHVPIYQFEKGRPEDVLSVSSLEACYVHFDGRSRLCPGAALCRLCSLGRDRRYIGYFGAMLQHDRILVRVTAQAAMRLMSHPPQAGVVYRIESRGSRKPLSIAQIGTAKAPRDQIMSDSALLRVLAGIYGLGILDPQLSRQDSLTEVQNRAKKIIDREVMASH